MRVLAVLLAAVLSASCGDASGPAAPPTSAVRFLPGTSGPTVWGDVPFPSDLYRDEAGTIALGELPTPLTATPLFDAMRALLAGRDGFCATCNVYFRIDGGLDAASVPGDTPEAAPSPDDAVLLADVDPASPERGRLFALRVQWDPSSGLLALRPERGVALHRSRRYAAALTTGLRAPDGTALGASEIFAAARDGRAADDAQVARVRVVTEPALAELERIGVARERVVALAAYTTEDVTADVLAVRATVQQGPSPALSGNAGVIRGSFIDDLLGQPSEDRPGIDVPPIEGTGGTRSIVHGSLVEVYSGAFLAPRIVEGRGTDVGVLRRDAEGRIVAGPLEPVPFVLTIPAVADRTRLPVVIAHHGFNASRITGFASAETAARAGVAVLAIDAFQHGDRAASASDLVNAMRGGIPGADGYAETEPLDVSGRVFGVLGTAPGLTGFTGYPHATLLQFAADVFSAVRALRDGALAELFADIPPLQPTGFDPERIGFVGNSLGAVVGASVLVAEPDVRAAVQNVPPGSIVETLAESPEFRPLVEAIFLPLLGITGPFDEVERRLLMDPVVDLTRWVLEPVDPLALAPYLVNHSPRANGPAEILFQVAATDEVAAPLATASMLDASGAPRVTRWDPAAHGMLEVLHQESRFEPPVVPPFRARPVPLPLENPIRGVHDELRGFLVSALVGD